LIDLAAENRRGWWPIHFDASRGKAQALNGALAQINFGEVVVVYDADHRPAPQSLTRLVAAFDDPSVAGASGRTLPANATASLPAYYATVESLVHQLITLRAKDRLALAPALLGSNCAYRRRALIEAGGFRAGALLEDSDRTLALARRGHRLRFVPDATAWHQAPETVEGYIRQHLRWARGFNDVARDHAGAALLDRQLPLRLRIELALFSLGYLDRLALLAGLALKVVGGSPRSPDGRRRAKDEPLGSVLKIALLMPLFQIAAALLIDRAPKAMWLRLPAVPLLFGLDILVAVRATLESLLNRPRIWTKTQRVSEPASQRS
jgi:GT2 family glycosyltransferase